jgi:hypothetical protein
LILRQARSDIVRLVQDEEQPDTSSNAWYLNN